MVVAQLSRPDSCDDDALARVLAVDDRKEDRDSGDGLVMAGFVVAHVSGNLFVFRGPDALNHYAGKDHGDGASSSLTPLVQFFYCVF
jgi:hypothetical protein